MTVRATRCDGGRRMMGKRERGKRGNERKRRVEKRQVGPATIINIITDARGCADACVRALCARAVAAIWVATSVADVSRLWSASGRSSDAVQVNADCLEYIGHQLPVRIRS
ncbi:hypothetical protein LSTR_LSTR013410 [Laodelphax striatellus]|uniref:Uncharacterized protein n=1 Tax=Laodelphax striatellus TaxID=195883 RepID=A0A482WGH8_LAOST|nr:hypothetical protein LSTR_LSTR015370 [Laodelphax striatellus]RZF44077.1 hypothetical protein LSTR_LSTR013410 [Laodelphax striatellus]